MVLAQVVPLLLSGLGMLWALGLTIALAALCRFLPGGIGDRSGGVGAPPPPNV